MGRLKRVAVHSFLATLAVFGLGAVSVGAITVPGTTVSVPNTQVQVTTPTVRVPSTAPTPPPAPKVVAPAPKPVAKPAPVVKQVTKPVQNVVKNTVPKVNNTVQKTVPKVNDTVKKTTGTVNNTVGNATKPAGKITGGGGTGGGSKPAGPSGPVSKVVKTVKGSLDSTVGSVRNGVSAVGGSTGAIVNTRTGQITGSTTALVGRTSLGGGSAGSSGTLVRTSNGMVFLGGPGGGGPAAPGGGMFGGDGFGGAGGGGFAGGAGGGSLAAMLAGASTKQLRSVLSHLEGCMPELPAVDRRVISMRAGLNGAAPMSQKQVGQRLGLSQQQVRGTERRAFNRLQYAAATTSCAAAVVGPFDVAGIGNLTGQLLYAGAVPVNGSALSLASNAADPFAAARGIVSRSASPLFDLGDGGGSGPAWVIILFTVLFSVAIAALTRELRSSF